MTRQLSWASKLIPTTAPLAVGNKQTFLFSSGKGVTGKMQSSDSDIPIMGSAQQHRHQLSRVFHSLRHQLGNRQTTRFIPKGITEPSIRVRAAGYKSWKIAQSELASDQSRAASFLSPHQVRYTLEQLHSRHFFARARVGAKTVKYML